MKSAVMLMPVKQGGHLKCFAVKGCPLEQRPLPECPEGVVADTEWWTQSRIGTQVVLAGRLESMLGATTQARCWPGRPCCNTERPHLIVVTAHGRVRLTSVANPPAFQCIGDQTGHCCPFEPFGEVLVRGTLAAPFANYVNYEVAEPQICTLVPSRTRASSPSREGEEE